MPPVTNKSQVETVAKKAIETLYGPGFKDLKVRVFLPYPNEHKQTGWDANVTFLLNGLQYTVDLLINEKDGQVVNARLIDTMTPL